MSSLDKWVSAAVTVAGFGYLCLALSLMTTIDFSSGIFPIIIGIVWLLLGGVYMRQSWASKPQEASEDETPVPLRLSIQRLAFRLIIPLGMYSAALPYLGYVLSTFLLIWWILKSLSGTGIVRSACWASVISCLMYIVFGVLLDVQLPSSWLLQEVFYR